VWLLVLLLTIAKKDACRTLSKKGSQVTAPAIGEEVVRARKTNSRNPRRDASLTSSCLPACLPWNPTMNNLPLEAFYHIFTYLDVFACIQNKGVCKSWRENASKSCGYMLVSSTAVKEQAFISEFTIKAQEVCSTGKEVEFKILKRTRGHLPEPSVLNGGTKLLTYSTSASSTASTAEIAKPSTPVSTRIMEVKYTPQSQIAIAIRFEQIYSTEMKYIASLDLESSRILTSFGGTQFTPKPHPIKKSIQVLDLGSLCHLKRLSVRGSNVITLRLPPRLVALDASGCTKLKEITFAVHQHEIEGGGPREDGLKLEALNLNGCRSLISGRFFSLLGAFKNMQELDMTSVSKLSKDLLVHALSGAECMKTISLRYIATDEILNALAASSAAVAELHLVDIAFSQVTDGAVEGLVRRAGNLERCNLRGCKGISGCCYNQVPIHLSRRVGEDETGHGFSVQYGDDSNGKRKRRKGDNIFYFVNK